MARKRAQFVTGVSPWSYLLVLLGVVGLVVLAVIIGATRKRATAAAWPICRRCQERHAKMLYLGAGLILGAVVLGVVSASTSQEAISPGLLLGVLVLIGGGMVLAQSSWAAVAGGRVIDGGQTVEFRRAHDAFVAQAMAELQAAAQHYAAQHAAYAAGPVPSAPQYAAPDVAASAAPHPLPAAVDFPQPQPTASPDVLSTPAADPTRTDQP